MAQTKSRRPRNNPFGIHPPTPTRSRGGCKVGWKIYASREDAARCSRWAVWQASEMAEQGYDFGYCTPGSIQELPDGMFEVCVP